MLYIHVSVHESDQIPMSNNSRVWDFHAEDCRSEPTEGRFLCGKQCFLPNLSKGVARRIKNAVTEELS